MFGRQSDPLAELAGRVRQAFARQDKRIDELQRQSIAISQHLAAHESDRGVSQVMDELKRREEHYAQVIMLAGYAGFFALWTQTRSDMSLWMFASTGALISISLITFVGFELYKSLRLGRFFSGDGPHTVDAVTKEIKAINKHWQPTFLVSSITGVVAGISLLLWFVFKTIMAAAHLTGAV